MGSCTRSFRGRRSALCYAGVVFVAWILIGAPAAVRAEPYVMEVATVVPQGSPWVAQLEAFKAYVETETNGRVHVNLRLGRLNSRSSARRTAAGSMQAFYGSVGGLSSVIRELNVLESPFLFETFAEADKALDDPEVQKQVRRLLRSRKLVFGFWAENGFRDYFSRRPIRTPSDLKGVRFRAQEAYAHVVSYRAYGASPVTTDMASALTSIQNGVVDGFDSTPIYAVASGLYQALEEGKRHLVLSRHIYQPGLMAYSRAWFAKLPKDIQDVLLDIPRDLVTQGRHRIRSVEQISIENLAKQGYEVYDLTPEERAAFKANQAGLAAEIAKHLGPGAEALLKAVRDTF
jgi:TRAP-type C4-dicarboxylate transport system substrate-binding protein